MADRPELPDQAQLEKLFRMLLGPEDEMDDVDVDLMLELYGIDPESLNDDLRMRLEREVEELRAQGAEVPPVMLEALDSFNSNTPPNDEVR